MMYMLDTNTIIYAIRHPEWDICKKIKKHLGKDLYISSITYGELEYGIMDLLKINPAEQQRYLKML